MDNGQKFQILNGFTLIELLVVIAIMAITGIFVFSNYKSFGEDQNLKNAVLDIQSLLRQAQTNATTNTKCDTQYGATWKVMFEDIKTVKLACQEPSTSPPPITKKTLTLGTNIYMSGGSSSCEPAVIFRIFFAPLNGKLDFISDNGMSEVSLPCTLLTITLRNIKTSNTKSLIIEKGGRIYVQ